MGALFNNFALIHHIDAVGMADRGKAVGDRNGGAMLGDFFEGFGDRRFGFIVHSRSSLVQNQNGRIFQNGAGDRQALPLATG